MTLLSPSVTPLRRPLDRLMPALFVGTSFLSAALLFSVQPMFTKLVLPILGGSASVWSIAMVFFQAVLLCGYGYTHLLTRFCRRTLVLPVHIGLAVLAILMLPVAIPAGWGAMPETGQAFWLLGLFGMAVGLPFFWLSANGPLLQAWYAGSGQKDADQPYFLYAASNIGSFAALLSYPVVIEPFIPLGQQTQLWAMGFVVLAAILALCGAIALRSRRAATMERPVPSNPVSVRVAWRDRLSWILLAFVPSGLLVSVTAHISTDVAAVPLLWVVPLALFLLTFVIAFSDRQGLASPAMARLQVWIVALALFNLVLNLSLWFGILVHLGAFFVSALVCHAALYRRRPAAEDLTEFYLFMSLGGCLGGIFCGLVAPQIFSTVLEYPQLLVCSLFCRPGFFAELRQGGWRRPACIALGCAVLIAIGHGVVAWPVPAGFVRLALVLCLAILLMANWRQPSWLLPSALAAAVVVMGFASPNQQAVRSFFGVHKLDITPDGRFLTLSHGTTMHGAERRLNDDGTPVTGRPEPTTYYTYEGGLGTGIASIRAAQGGSLKRVAAIGLGSGSLACHSAPGEDWTFYEIDPEVLKIARDPNYFHFLSSCAPQAPVVLGDARLTIDGSAGGENLIVIDAFSSDSIPAHLVTVEAFRLYRQKLQQGGAMLVHISNRHLDLTNILARTAAEVGLVAYEIQDDTKENFQRRYRTSSTVMAFAGAPADLGAITNGGIWKPIAPDMTRRAWTDDFTNIIEAVWDKYRSPTAKAP